VRRWGEGEGEEENGRRLEAKWGDMKDVKRCGGEMSRDVE
jgi:hypothetical protein